MCGICGFAGFNDKELLKKMADSISHRGPDDEGSYENDTNTVHISQKRLSIIDLQTGKQPIYNENGKLLIIFNGEIYNYRELRDSLIEKGHRFKTNSDTETILHLYEEYKEETPKHLNGIFAFVIYDIEKNELFAARDHFGIKPLYYFHQNGRLLFGSEIKAILQWRGLDRRLNFEALHCHLNLRYLPGSFTLMENILKLPAGCAFVFKVRQNNFNLFKYFENRYMVDEKMTEGEAVEGIRFYLRQAVKRQLISDVPLGTYLSGGLDSSSVVAYASEFTRGIKTFSMGFNEPTDEVSDARMVAEYYHANFYETYIKLDPLGSMKEVLWHVEEPKVNMMQGYFLSKFARKEVKVALSGLGGDELFAGYVNNKFLYPLEFLHRILPKNNPLFNMMSSGIFNIENSIGNLKFDELRRGLQMMLSYGDKNRFYSILRNVWDYDSGFYRNIYSADTALKMKNYQAHSLFEDFFRDKKKSIIEQSLYAEINTKMIEDFLLNEDRTSMANSLEVRVPFLDLDLVKFALSIPYKMKIKGNTTKYIFKKAMKGVLPDFVLTKKKWGFAINPYYQFKKDLKSTAIEVLNEKRIKEQGIFNYDYIRKIINHPVSPRLRWHYYYLWQLIGFQYWYDMFIKGNRGGNI